MAFKDYLPDFVKNALNLNEATTTIVNDVPQLNVDYRDQLGYTDFPEMDRFDFLDYNAFSKFRTLSNDRRVQYDAYDEMTKDIIISSVLSLYTEDATQYDTMGRVIWVEADDPDTTRYLNDLIEILEIPKKLRAIIYSLVEYGDVYLRLYKKPKNTDDRIESTDKVNNTVFVKPDSDNQLLLESNRLLEGKLDLDIDYEDYVEIVDDPENVYDLLFKGKTCQFVVSAQTGTINKQARIELYPPDQFVHICIENTHVRDRENFEFWTKDKLTGEKQLHQYKVRRGKSLLYDIYPVEKEIQLLESSLLLNRLSKSAITRLVSVEVGDTPKPEVRNITRRIKSALESKLSIDKAAGSIRSYNSPGGLDNVVVNPTRNGKGTVQTQTIGGDFDPKSLIDLDYFNNKRFGGLRVPKAFLGWEEAVGSGSGASLTKLDSRYGRTVKSIQNSVIFGITDLLNLFLLHRNMSNRIGTFKVRLVSPTTVEDTDRDELVMNRLNLISSFLSVAESARVSYTNELFTYLLTKYVSDPGIIEILQKHKNDAPPSDDDDGGSWH